ncbi:hypothetical protein [Serratia marcescens]|uniref:hypothetical protein n=1 Tax=Serratia marcescens TaxID=615 RepID=UPI000AE9E256|nr:hypothetical protein [Serratia marcescens]
MSEHLEPLDQLYLINAELMKYGDKFSSPIVTVGGQAVHYWAVWYQENYASPPPEQYITSNDIDVTARKVDIDEICSVLDVPAEFNDGTPPSLAILPMKNIKDGNVKTYLRKKFVNKQIFDAENKEVPNVMDVLSSASYLKPTDFEGEKLKFNTEMFLLPLEGFQYTPHKNIRVLNPIACMASRLHNVTTGVKRNVTQEVERIKALMVPVVVFILEKFLTEDFRTARKYLGLFEREIGKSGYRRFIVTHDLDVIKMLNAIISELSGMAKFKSEHSDFITLDLPRVIDRWSVQIDRKKAQIHREELSKKK